MATRYFHWDVVDDCVLHETDGGGATTVEYSHEPTQYGPLLSESRSGVESCHHYDALGSTVALSDTAGNTTDTFQYDAWGNEIVRTGSTPTPYTWVGRWGYQHDTPTGGYYVRARSYQPTVARWMSVDPIRAELRDGYRYVKAIPVHLIDPSGKAVGIGWGLEVSVSGSYDGAFAEVGARYSRLEETEGCPANSRKTIHQLMGFAGVGLGFAIKLRIAARIIQLQYVSVRRQCESGVRCETNCTPCNLPSPLPTCCGACTVIAYHVPLIPIWPLPTQIGLGILGNGFTLEGSWQIDGRFCCYVGASCTRPGCHIGFCLGIHLEAEWEHLLPYWPFYTWGTVTLDESFCFSAGTSGINIGGDDSTGIAW